MNSPGSSSNPQLSTTNDVIVHSHSSFRSKFMGSTLPSVLNSHNVILMTKYGLSTLPEGNRLSNVIRPLNKIAAWKLATDQESLTHISMNLRILIIRSHQNRVIGINNVGS